MEQKVEPKKGDSKKGAIEGQVVPQHPGSTKVVEEMSSSHDQLSFRPSSLENHSLDLHNDHSAASEHRICRNDEIDHFKGSKEELNDEEENNGLLGGVDDIENSTTRIEDSGPRTSDVPEPYSWESWLGSTQAMDEGTAIFEYSDSGPFKVLNVRPPEDYSNDPNIVGTLCVMCRWMFDHLRLIIDYFTYPLYRLMFTLSIGTLACGLSLQQTAVVECVR
ncbi:uncharacterized protein LY89DRAFT_126569 [Mollisia scopiformis]|uniref:Uncharacterized protein n=1 Tax=Mollisia scopiformis TaxID=149040 RepID=A0A194X460_MOLSC|nr:uncharacterized protein LY89DRAFT_126569 [Mollisia scopiformis]KUJ14968.1 hypothetical protein LY89DRAFT_126569 [Mollisia scopiformis]